MPLGDGNQSESFGRPVGRDHKMVAVLFVEDDGLLQPTRIANRANGMRVARMDMTVLQGQIRVW